LNKVSPGKEIKLKSPATEEAGISRNRRLERAGNLKLELRSPPMTPLGVVTDCVARPHADPLRNRSVLLLLFRQHFLDLQRFVRSHLCVRWAFSRAPMSLLNKILNGKEPFFFNLFLLTRKALIIFVFFKTS